MKEKMNRDKQIFINIRQRRKYFYAKFRKMSGSAGNNYAKFPRCPPAPELIRTMSVRTPPN